MVAVHWETGLVPFQAIGEAIAQMWQSALSVIILCISLWGCVIIMGTLSLMLCARAFTGFFVWMCLGGGGVVLGNNNNKARGREVRRYLGEGLAMINILVLLAWWTRKLSQNMWFSLSFRYVLDHMSKQLNCFVVHRHVSFCLFSVCFNSHVQATKMFVVHNWQAHKAGTVIACSVCKHWMTARQQGCPIAWRKPVF